MHTPGADEPERVLPPKQTAEFEQLIRDASNEAERDSLRRIRDMWPLLEDAAQGHSAFMSASIADKINPVPNQPRTPVRGVRVPDELWDAAKERAEANGETVSDVIREALVRYVEQ